MGRDEFDRLWREARPDVARVIGRMIPDRELRDDVEMETALKAYGKRADCWEGRFGAWVRLIATNTAIDVIRKLAFRRTLSLDLVCSHCDGEPLTLSDLLGSRRDDYGQVATRMELDEIVALAGSRQRLYVDAALRLAQGESREEIARTDGLPYGTVRTRAHRGRIALREAAKELAA